MDEKLRFDETYKAAKIELDKKYSDEITAETERLESEILQAKEEKNEVVLLKIIRRPCRAGQVKGKLWFMKISKKSRVSNP